MEFLNLLLKNVIRSLLRGQGRNLTLQLIDYQVFLCTLLARLVKSLYSSLYGQEHTLAAEWLCRLIGCFEDINLKVLIFLNLTDT